MRRPAPSARTESDLSVRGRREKFAIKGGIVLAYYKDGCLIRRVKKKGLCEFSIKEGGKRTEKTFLGRKEKSESSFSIKGARLLCPLSDCD